MKSVKFKDPVLKESYWKILVNDSDDMYIETCSVSQYTAYDNKIKESQLNQKGPPPRNTTKEITKSAYLVKALYVCSLVECFDNASCKKSK